MSEFQSGYQPGVCNIGPAEIQRRFQVAIIALVLFILTAIALISSDASTGSRLIAFVPAMAASVGYMQARRKFCLAYGFAGLFSLNKLGDVTKVVDPAALKADRAYALRILISSLSPAAAMTAAVLFI